MRTDLECRWHIPCSLGRRNSKIKRWKTAIVMNVGTPPAMETKFSMGHVTDHAELYPDPAEIMEIGNNNE